MNPARERGGDRGKKPKKIRAEEDVLITFWIDLLNGVCK